MKQIVPYLLWLILSLDMQQAMAQFVKVDLSPGHRQKLQKTKSYKKKFIRYRKFTHKDSVRQAKAQIKVYTKRLDSLEKTDALRRTVYADLGDIQKQLRPDTSAVSFNYLKQAAREAGDKEALAKLEQMEHTYAPLLSYRDSLLSIARDYDSLLVAQDSAAWGYVEQMAPGQLSSMAASEWAALAGYTPPSLDQLGTPDQVGDYGQKVQTLVNQIPDQPSMKEASREQLAQLKATQAQMKIDKLKYAQIGDSNDGGTMKKNNSLAGIPLSKRLYLGGNLHLVSTDPIAVELTPQLGYYLTRSWAAGMGFSWQDSFGGDSLAHSQAQYGYNFFTSYVLLKNLFAYGEYNRSKNARMFGENVSTGSWSDHFLVGLGLNIRVSALVVGHFMLLYDLEGEVAHRWLGLPVVLKFGFKLSEIGRTRLF